MQYLYYLIDFIAIAFAITIVVLIIELRKQVREHRNEIMAKADEDKKTV